MQYLKDFAAFLEGIGDDFFTREPSSHPFTGSIGAHTRHVIEFYRQFLDAIEAGTINYDERKRDKAIELDRLHAIGCLRAIEKELSSQLVDWNKPVGATINGHLNQTS